MTFLTWEQSANPLPLIITQRVASRWRHQCQLQNRWHPMNRDLLAEGIHQMMTGPSHADPFSCIFLTLRNAVCATIEAALSGYGVIALTLISQST